MENLPTLYQKFIHTSRYARWLDNKKRRETWPETVERYFDFFRKKFEAEDKLSKSLEKKLEECQKAVLNLEIMPSMRALMTAGKALEKDPVAGYNCSFVSIDDQKSFDEILFILMCGTGVGFSVEKKYVDKLPEIPKKIYPTETTIVVPDSKIGWATSLRELISLLYAGKEPKWDVSKLRPAGARLKTFGGRSSGPEPLVDLFKFAVALFKQASGRKLTSIECHDLVCKIADVVVVGGTRRSALISLSDLNDREMQFSKSGEWWNANPQRRLANNSSVYEEKPPIGVFMQEWLSLYNSKSGERGIFNRQAAKKQVERNSRRDSDFEFGTNPCSEILLRPQGLCNLSEVVVRPNDTPKTLERKVELATILGTIQSTLTNFRYLRDKWRENCEEERLLGVSLTGIMDNKYTSKKEELPDGTKLPVFLDNLKNVAILTNEKWAKKLDINQSAAITCVKPSGTVSQLVDSSSGIHPRYARYYIRRVRQDKKDPLSQMMIDQGFPYEEDTMNPSNWVFSFRAESPKGSIVRDQISAIDQMKLWLIYSRHWCEHKPSITVYVKEDEWLAVADFVYRYFDHMSGVSFLPHTEHSYKQAPYEEITEEQYEQFLQKIPKVINWDALVKYEKEDGNTNSVKELACSGSSCEI